MGSAKKLNINSFEDYINNLKDKFNFKESREHAYRPALQNYIESFPDIKAINDAARIKCGAPDFIVYKKQIPIGYIETKNIGKNLTKEEESKQIKKYHSLGNLVLTNYLEFRWYVDGEKRLTVKLGEAKKGLNICSGSEEDLNNLFENFFSEKCKTIQNANELAQRLATTTISIRNLIVQSLDLENDEKGWLHRWLKAFREVLIDNLDKETFADMFAQTLTYGFFAARVHHSGKVEFSRFSAAKILPKTNPFLRKLFAQFTGVDMPDTINWAVDEVVELLKRSDMDSILENFGYGTGKDDPVVHFYETFLAAYNPQLREMRGVYYTPTPVVDFIVRSVDILLSEKFGKDKGLADDETLILDPAVGTASFLHRVIEKIYSKFSENKGLWNSYVGDNLLDRVFGFEILMAPYSVAHLKLGLQLQDTGYNFDKDQRLGIFLTNTLEEAAKKSQEMLFNWISDEANSASSIKKDRPIMVVIGNPPYSGHSVNKGEWIQDLLKGHDRITKQGTDNYFMCDGKPLGEKNPKWLNDDYVKFIRFSQWRIKQTGHGILAFITNHGFLDNITFRGMRESLIQSFDEIYLLDLHGNYKKNEKCPDGSKDENVFDIQQGVSICFFIRQEGNFEKKAKIYKKDIFGLREKKYKFLLENDIKSINWKEIKANGPFYLFSINQDENLQNEFNSYPKLIELFPKNVLGFQTHRDHFAIAHTKKEIEKRLLDLRDSNLTTQELKDRYNIKETSFWKIENIRANIQNDRNWKKKIVKCSYRPFDNRWCYLDKSIMDRPRPELINFVSGKENICIISSRQQAIPGYYHSWISKLPANDCLISTKSREANQVFPLFVHHSSSSLEEFSGVEPNKEVNIEKNILKSLEDAWGVNLAKIKKEKSFTAEQVAYYIYAILNSMGYRERYKDLLKIDYPRIPFVKNFDLFSKISEKGQSLSKLHFLNKEEVKEEKVNFPIPGKNKIESIKYCTEKERLYLNKTQYFSGINETMWKFKIGGYEVLSKWLKDRPKKKLTYENIKMFKKIIFSCQKTIFISKEIDDLIQEAGGWPINSIDLSVKSKHSL